MVGAAPCGQAALSLSGPPHPPGWSMQRWPRDVLFAGHYALARQVPLFFSAIGAVLWIPNVPEKVLIIANLFSCTICLGSQLGTWPASLGPCPMFK